MYDKSGHVPGNKKPLCRFSLLTDSAADRAAEFLREPRHHQMQETNNKNGNRNNFAIFAGSSIT